MIIFEKLSVIDRTVRNLKTAGLLKDCDVENYRENVLKQVSNGVLLSTMAESHHQRELALENGYAVRQYKPDIRD